MVEFHRARYRMSSTARNAFRLDINLLRVIAVTGVVLYHFRIGALTGGFAGVDLFFVVSGYLMTRIICDGIDRGTFSLWRFYIARARRIVPALAAFCLVMLVVSQVWIDPLTRREIASDIVSSILFISNFAYWRDAGYFDAAAASKWLLHTWSLSVEWQFYLVLPLALLALRRVLPGRRYWLAALWIGMLLSFALAVVLAELKPAFAFYLLPTRAWEMLAGGLVYLHLGDWRAGPRLSSGLALIGLALIAVAFFGLDNLVAVAVLRDAAAGRRRRARHRRAPGNGARTESSRPLHRDRALVLLDLYLALADRRRPRLFRL
ncbi:MAG: acyltransferase [Candidatus Kaistia colombiensis]|nr:MAG: acyltransferase [Kaistia sp.]